MPVQNALATVRLDYEQKIPGAPYHVSLMVWSRSYDNPTPGRRNALIREVYLTNLKGNNIRPQNVRITDRYGIDETELWEGAGPIGWIGYREWDSVGRCGPNIGVVWSSYTGIYDERCLADFGCDAMRLQTYIPSSHQVVAWNYLLSPVTFSFDVSLNVPPKSVKLVMDIIGGNGGNPAQRSAATPGTEPFVIEFP